MHEFRLKVTQIILTKIVLITPPETRVWEITQLSDSKCAGAAANWCRLGYELSVVKIATDVWIPSDWLIKDDIQHC